MPIDDKGSTYYLNDKQSVPFKNAEEAWFWFIAAQDAKNDGARITAGQALYPRPCEPIDILKVVERLYRGRRLLMDHLKVMRHYGRRRYAPDNRRVKEFRAFKLWSEAMARIEPALENKGIIVKSEAAPFEGWQREALVFENTHVRGVQ